ncbi:MAG TPA: hybrid sensor histidine kinase/response regulator [Myxococcales bacterium]|nr:hybrid sensor histidine kinase/response regulator [Myxococcales bacterium]
MMEDRVKCLLVDDVEENLLALAALLRREDVELLQARSGAEALELLLVHDVALALIDVQMPVMDGFELAELMRGAGRTRHVPIVFITAGVRDRHRQFKGYELGAIDFLYKPVEPHVLKNKAEVFFQLQRQKQQLAHELQRRTEMLRINETFSAVLGHDLRNPLSAILTFAATLRTAQDDHTRSTIRGIEEAGWRMKRMIDELLDLSRARLAGGIAVRPQRTELGRIVSGVVDECRAAFPERSVDVTAEGDLHGVWDPDRLSQLVSNLIGNALEHGAGGKPVRVSLDGTRGEMVSLVVTNQGSIPPGMADCLFDPFRTSQQRKGRKGGLGLGLYIVQQIVVAHRGRVAVESGQDSTSFRAELPRDAGETVTHPTITISTSCGSGPRSR